MRAILISTLKIIGFFAIWAIGTTAFIMVLIEYRGGAFEEDVKWRLVAEIGGLVAVAIALLVMGLAVDRRPASTLGFPLRRLADLLLGAVVGIVIFCLPILILMALGYARYAPDFSQFDPVLLIWLTVSIFFGAATEELVVRSYMFQELWRKYSAGLAVAVSTIVFVGLHGQIYAMGTQEIVAGADIAIAGVMLGVAYLRSGALWLPIGIHFGWNAFQGPVLGINVTGFHLGGNWHAFAIDGPALWTGGVMGVEGGLAGLAGPLLGILIVLLLPQRPSPFETAGTSQA